MQLVRLVENNDWITLSVFGCILALMLAFLSLNREASIKEFLLQKIEDAPNVFLTWVVISAVFCVQLTLLFSQYLPAVPKVVENVSIMGFSLNKFGYLFLIVSIFYLFKTVFTFFFYVSINQSKNFNVLIFNSSKIFFVFSMILIILVFLNYYINIETRNFLPIILVLSAFLFVFKIFFYLFNKNNTLPNQWYYKILYICTLQIAPVFAMWRLVFFN